jgi:phosphatidylglycerol lysyltransferase
MNAAHPDERSRVLALLRRFGREATSFQVLERGFRYWFDGDAACVAYVDTGGAWVAAGGPIADSAHAAEVAARFVSAARAARRRACFFATEKPFAEQGGCASIHIGEQPVWDPTAWETVLRESKSLREQVRRARAKGVEVKVLAPEDVAPGAAMRLAIESLIARWIGTRTMAPMGFLVDVQPFKFASERRYFVAQRAGEVVGFLAAVPVYARAGWFFEDLLRDPSAPNGTAELLVDAAMRDCARDDARYVTLGLAPLAGPVHGWLRVARDRLSLLYDFHGLRAFKARLRPQHWEAIHLSHPRGTSSTVALYDSLAAFARGSFARFAVQSALRGPAIVVRVLAVLLVPWTLALAIANTTRWFPSRAVQVAWVVFDVLVAAGLFVLAARWRRWLAHTLAVAITFDAALTLVEAAAFNAPRVRSVLDAVVVAVSCVAPAAAAAILWGALRERRRNGALVAAGS